MIPVASELAKQAAPIYKAMKWGWGVSGSVPGELEILRNLMLRVEDVRRALDSDPEVLTSFSNTGGLMAEATHYSEEGWVITVRFHIEEDVYLGL